MASFENIFEIALFWLIGIISGILIDRLKYSHAEIIRVVTLERVSNILDVISSEITVDYNACVGLAKALTNSNGNSVGDEVSAKILLQRLEHLGTHINNIQELSPPKPTMRIKYSIFQLVKIAVEETKQTDTNFEITLSGTKKLTGIYIKKDCNSHFPAYYYH